MQIDDSSIKPKEKSLQHLRWKIQPEFGNYQNFSDLATYIHALEARLEKVILQNAYFEDEGDFLSWIQGSLPLIEWTISEDSPEVFTLFLLCKASKFYKTEVLLIQYIRERLDSYKKVSLLSFEHLYFHFIHLPEENLLSLQMRILIEDASQLGLFKRSIFLLTQEMKEAMQNPAMARYFFEIKGFSKDFKSTLIFKELTHLLHKFPYYFEPTIFAELKKFLTLIAKEFLESRSPRHLVKILATHYMMRNSIARSSALFPGERHLQLRLTKTRLQFLFGTKSVVGLIIGICMLDRYEFFEEKHILLAVQKIIPHARAVKGSFYTQEMPQDMIRVLYLEIEKKDGDLITLQERRQLKKLLADELKARVEKLIPAVFMKRNEEEIMKSILILSQELKYLSDLPQLVVTLEQQTASDLIFTIVLVRLLRKNTPSLEQLFQKIHVHSNVELTIDRVQIVGYLRKKYPKEANTFRLQIPKEPFLLRADSSVNFYLARLKILNILNEVLGELRDYNGGMILQQVEQFSELKQAFPEIAASQPDLLEDFFYALTPIEIQATLPLNLLCALLQLLLETISEELLKRESFVIKAVQKKTHIFLLIRAREASYREHVQRALSQLEIVPKSLCSTHVGVQGSYCSGFIYDCSDPDFQQLFLGTIQQALKTWQQKLHSQQILRLSYLYFPISLDPRIGGDEHSERLLELLFEGLMRIGADGKPVCAIAKSYAVSSDMRKYTFTLRDTVWSNGDPVVAFDFEYAWKKILSPDFSTPFVYLFYLIKNAKNAKEGKVSMDEVGVHAIDDRTLVVELEHPAHYFLELIAYTPYSPVNHHFDRIHPNWSDNEGKGYVCNGPFQLNKRSKTRGYELVKNLHYWEVEQIHLDQILVRQNNTYTALEMFKNDEIDWLGRPLSTWDASFNSSCPEKTECCSVPRIFWYVFNVKQFPFGNVKLRRAFAYGINRQSIFEELSYAGSPASTPLPIALTQLLDRGMIDNNREAALILFEEALSELKMTRADFPILTLIQNQGDTRYKTALLIARQWQELFGIRCKVESLEWSALFDKMTHGDYQIGGINWKSWTTDPSYTLNAFRYASEKLNFAKWENADYQRFLDAADQEIVLHKRLEYLRLAEEILLREMPVIPICYEAEKFKRKKRLNVTVNFFTGDVDFSRARITPVE